MTDLRFGVVYRTQEYLRQHARREDPVDFVVLRSTFIDPPRAAGARSIAETIRQQHPQAELVPYVWNAVTHTVADGVTDRGTRTVPGEERGLGHLQSSPEVDHAWKVMLTALDGFGAQRAVLRTPATFGPGSLHRKRLAEFSQRARNDGIHLVWEPEGLWTVEVARPIAAANQLEIMVAATSVTGRVSPDLGPGWLRVEGELPGRIAETLAYELADKLADIELPDPDEAVASLVFSGPRAYANLRNFSRAWRLCQEDG